MVEFDPTLVHDWLSRSAERFGEKEAIIFGRQRWTYKALDAHTRHLATALLKAGLKRQDRVVVLLGNTPETVISIYGILKAGGTFVNLEGSVKAPKLSYILENSGARILITHTSKAKVARQAVGHERHCKIIWTGPASAIPPDLYDISLGWEDIFSDFNDNPAPVSTSGEIELPRCIDVDLACLIYTSGSTGQPKGVMSTHHNMISAARSIAQYLQNEADDIILNVLPLSFDYGLYQVIMAFMFGGTVVLEKSFLYLHKVLMRISEEKVTGFPIVPTILAMLLNLEDFEKYDFSSLRYMTNTGAALPVEHIRSLRRLLPHVRIYSMFGLTECKRVGYLPPEEIDNKPSSVGMAMPNCETFILDENGNQLPPGQTGELVIRGSNVMQGYWKSPELTARTYKDGVYPADKRLHSGDYFHKDKESFLYFVGRKDDMIKSKGERISPKEVENNISAMDGVVEVAIIGVSDEILGQAIKAFIVPASGKELTERDVLRFCTQNMESFMVPKYILFMDELPRTPNGKIDKKTLQKAGMPPQKTLLNEPKDSATSPSSISSDAVNGKGDSDNRAGTDWDIFQSYKTLINPTYPDFLRRLGLDSVAVSAEGATITDATGTTYIDCTGGYGIFNVGHNNPEIIKALTEQLAQKQLFTRPLISDVQVRLAECLRDIAPGDLNCSYIFNSGSEAMDCALKLIRLYRGSKQIIAMENAFHGHTFGALSVSGISSFKRSFRPLVPGIRHVPFGDVTALAQEVSSETGAVVLEPIQHEAGVSLPPAGYLQAVRRICDEHGLLMVCDEVKTAFGKTGHMFACECFGVVPDILVIGKSLGGGLMPIGGLIAKPTLWNRFGLSFSMSASSFAGNVLACRAALATIQYIRKNQLLDHCREKGPMLQGEIARTISEFPSILKSVTGMGLLLSVETAAPKTALKLVQAMIRRGVLVLTAYGNPSVIMVEPPLVITVPQIKTVGKCFMEACEEVKGIAP